MLFMKHKPDRYASLIKIFQRFHVVHGLKPKFLTMTYKTIHAWGFAYPFTLTWFHSLPPQLHWAQIMKEGALLLDLFICCFYGIGILFPAFWQVFFVYLHEKTLGFIHKREKSLYCLKQYKMGVSLLD